MPEYMIYAKATWKEGGEDPRGHQPDFENQKSRELNNSFRAKDDATARNIAYTRLLVFKKRLPKKLQGVLTWRTKPRIVRVRFAQVLPLM